MKLDKNMLDIYSDYLICSFGYTTATGLSRAVDGVFAHDKVTRFLSARKYDSKTLWKVVKKNVRETESEQGVILFDDTIIEKQYTDENDIIAWHWDHSKGRSVKGVNMLSCIYQNKGINIPVAFDVVKKTKKFKDKKTGKLKRRSEVTKNEQFREMIGICVRNNRIKLKWILADVWYSSAENMRFIKSELKRDFIMPIKSNRLVALSKRDKTNGNFVNVETLDFKKDTEVILYIKGINFPVAVIKKVFINEDGSIGILYLACSDTTKQGYHIYDIYNKRWNIEGYHKSIKTNIGLAKSPTKTEITQNNHFFASIYAYLKLELLKCKTNLNHFAIKSRLYVKALKTSINELEYLKTESLCA